jgi:hypothetical protein
MCVEIFLPSLVIFQTGLQKPAGRLNSVFRQSIKTGFLKQAFLLENVHVWGQDQSQCNCKGCDNIKSRLKVGFIVKFNSKARENGGL